MKKKEWLFHWVEGGYNTVLAATYEEALALAKKKGEPNDIFLGLTVNEATLHVAKPGEVEKIDRRYAGMFD